MCYYYQKAGNYLQGRLYVKGNNDMNKQQIGRAGELLVQYKLLIAGIESSQMTTDAGIDLVAFSNKQKKAYTIQVKTNEKPKPGGGKGSKALDWWLSQNTPAELVALVDLSSANAWLFTQSEFAENAQQHSNGNDHFYIYTTEDVKTKKKARLQDYENYILEKRIKDIFSL
jgi:hypothetical protein